MYACSLLALLLMLAGGCLAATYSVFNVSLEPEDLSLTNSIDVEYFSKISVSCPTGKDDYQIINLPDGVCPESIGDNVVIGSCLNSPLVIYIKTLPIHIPGVLSFDIGKTYYFGAFDGSSNQPCEDGIKFSLHVVSEPSGTTNTEQVVSSTTTPIMPSPSIDTPITSDITRPTTDWSSLPSVTTTSTLLRIITTSSTLDTTATRPTSTSVSTHDNTDNERPTDFRDDDPLADGIANHSVCAQSLLSLVLMFLTLTTVVLLTLL